MIPNGLKVKWAEGKPTLNAWLSIANSFSAEVMAETGFDSVTVDMQHGVVDYQAAVGMLQAMRASGVTPMARVPWLDPAHIMKALDAGAYGIICPMINNAEEAARLVSYMRYPPLGVRSFGPTRAMLSAGSDYASKANSELICLAMIETADGMANLEEIVRTPGLDGVYVGPADLSLGLSNGALPPGFDREEPEMVEAIKKIASACRDAGVIASLHCGAPEYAARAISWGYHMTTLQNDSRLMASAAKTVVDQTRAILAGGSAPMPAASEQGKSY